LTIKIEVKEMAVQITIIGLGQIGASVGLALEKHSDKFLRIGHDIDSGIANMAKKMGALDKVVFNLPNAVEEADIVLLAVPVSQVEDLLNLIMSDLKEGAVILDTSPIRQVPTEWAREALSEGRYYVGFTPMINPLFLEEAAGGTEAAHADLFDHGLVAITAPSGTVSAAMKLASDLAEMMNSTPLFADEMEIDSYMAAVHVMPQLIAAALANTTISRPGWLEGRKFAGKAYSLASSPITSQDQPEAVAAASLHNQENTVRVLDWLIEELQTIRDHVSQGKQADLIERLKQARDARVQWISERGAANWAGESAPEADYESAKPNLFGRFGTEKKDE
jgi:prephenate dehydrogenase